MKDKIIAVLIGALMLFSVIYFVWGIGYQGEPYSTVDTESALRPVVVNVGEKFVIRLPKSDNPNQVWFLVKDSPRVEQIEVIKSGDVEQWWFRGIKKGNSPLEFSWSYQDRGVWPSDERKIVNVEVR